jgi:hypothetical protein
MMQNGARPVVLALFFVLGMAFTAAMFLFARPDWENHDKVRIITEQAPAKISRRNYFPEIAEPQIAAPPPEEIRAEPAAAPAAVQAEQTKPTPKELTETQFEVAVQPSLATPIRLPTRQYPAALAQPNKSAAPLSFANRDAAKVLRGRAILDGKPPEEKIISLDPACGRFPDAPRRTRLYVVGPNNGLADVVVKVTGLPDRHWIRPVDPLVIAQRKCMFEPYVSAIQLGQSIRLVNEDPFMHNVHIIPRSGGEKNHAQMPRSKPIDFKPSTLEDFLKIRCDVHPWMFAYVTVVDHPYFAVTDAEGRFEIKGLPVGRYTLTAMHRKSGTLQQEVEIKTDGGEANFEFKVANN